MIKIKTKNINVLTRVRTGKITWFIIILILLAILLITLLELLFKWYSKSWFNILLNKFKLNSFPVEKENFVIKYNSKSLVNPAINTIIQNISVANNL